MLRRSRSSSFSLYSFASSPFFAMSSKLKKERYNLMALTTRKVVASVPTHEKATHTPLLASSRKYIWLALNYLLMSLLAIFFLFPIVFMIISSLKADENQLLEDVTTLRAFIPYGDLSLQNYNDAFQRFPFGLYLFNSLVIVTCIVTLGLLVNSLMAYALARMTFPGRKLILILVVVLVVIPFESVAVPLLLLVNQFPWFNGATTWVDSSQVQIIPFIADAFSIFLFYQFFIDIPKDIDEAAFVYGASHLRDYRLAYARRSLKSRLGRVAGAKVEVRQKSGYRPPSGGGLLSIRGLARLYESRRCSRLPR